MHLAEAQAKNGDYLKQKKRAKGIDCKKERLNASKSPELQLKAKSTNDV